MDSELFQVPFGCTNIMNYKPPHSQTPMSPNCGASTGLSLGLINPRLADILTAKGKGIQSERWRQFLLRRGVLTTFRRGPIPDCPLLTDATTVCPDFLNYFRRQLFPQSASFVLIAPREEGRMGHYVTLFKGLEITVDAAGKRTCKKTASEELFIFDAQRERIVRESEWPAYFQDTIDAIRDLVREPRIPATELSMYMFIYGYTRTAEETVHDYINKITGSTLLAKYDAFARARRANGDVDMDRDIDISDAVDMDVDDDAMESTVTAATRVDAYEEVGMGARGGRLTRRRSSLPRRRGKRSSSAKRRTYSRRRRA
jgi:hypothetical protein